MKKFEELEKEKASVVESKILEKWEKEDILNKTIENRKNNKSFNGVSQLDEYYLPINLKGTKPSKMPRISKKRQKNGTGSSGISRHTVCVVSGVDEYNNMIFKIAGTSNVSSYMIKNTIEEYVLTS